MLKITTCEELERTHLRFLKVNDNKKLSDILAKLLPNILMVFFEDDLQNVSMSQEPPKIKAIEEIVSHLLMKVTNSKGDVKVPFAKLIAIFSSDQYIGFTNAAVKNHGRNRIMDFIFAYYLYLPKNLESDTVEIFDPVLKSLKKLSDGLQEKNILVVLMIYRMKYYATENKSMKGIAPKIMKIFQEMNPNLPEGQDDMNKMELLSCFYNFVLIQQEPEAVKNKMMMQTQNQSLQFMHETFRDKVNLDDSWANCIINSIYVILNILQDTDLFQRHESIPLILFISLGKYGKVADYASSYLKSYFQDFDRNDNRLVENVFRMIQNENFYKIDEPQAQQMAVLESDEAQVQEMPVIVRKHMIDFLLKYECSANTSQTYNIKLIDKCITDYQDFSVYALKLINHMIKYNTEIDQEGFNVIQKLKYFLVRIRNTSDMQESSDLFQQLSYANVYVCFADLAYKNYSQIFNSEALSISKLAIEAFEKLRDRVQEILKVKPIREDELCLIYMEALNKFRNIIETNETDQQIKNEKQVLLSLVTKSLNKELVLFNKTQTTSNCELIYILFLYLASLDTRKDPATGNLVPNPAILLQAVSLKEHEDIKIRKEASKQIELFEKLVKQKDKESKSYLKETILRPLVQEVKKFFLRSDILLFDENLKDYLNLTQGKSFQQSQYTPIFIEQCLEISRFTMNFFEQVYDEPSSDPEEQDYDIFDILQRQLLMNINWNFTSVKSDFVEPLNLIQSYLSICQQNPSIQAHKFDIICTYGSPILFKYPSSSNLDQSIIALEILANLIGIMDQSQKDTFKNVINAQEIIEAPQPVKVSHEGNLRNTINLTLAGLLVEFQTMENVFLAKIKEVDEKLNKAMTPNVKEEVKLLVVCVGLLAKRGITSVYDEASKLIMQTLEKKDLTSQASKSQGGSVNTFRIHLIRSLYKIVENSSNKQEFCTKLLKHHIEQDYHDVHIEIGIFLAKLCKSMDYLSTYVVNFLMDFIKSREKTIFWEKEDQYPITLNTRRNCVIYLNEALQLYGKTEEFMKEKFVEMQKMFLKYIFDKKPAIQDISSKALTLIYQIGSPEVKESLVQSLSQRLAGDEKAQTEIGGETNEDKDEDRELNLEFHDSTSTEQRKKLKTYKDLCKIAVDIGHKEMIYQFLEVHRHISRYQDMSKAAKGLSNIIMLDDRLKNDLLKITPKILMLTYDYNDEVRDTMRQLWSTLIDIDKEQQIIEEKWPEILKEALSYIKQKEFRKRLSACLVLQDLLPNRTWAQVRDHFKELFLGSLTLLDDDIEGVKKAALDLAKTIKRLTLKFANIYANNDIEELEEVLALLIPMTIDEVIKSNMKIVKFYGVNMLFEIVKSSTQERMYQNLKIQNKYERQVAFNYNSEQKMKEILNRYLDRIVIEVIQNLSQMNTAVEKINQIEQYAIDKNIYSDSRESGQNKISEGQINDLRVKYTRDSEWGEILTICRKQMEEPTFDKILVDLLNLMVKGHDLVTKSTAILFVQDIILENRMDLITPKNSRKIANRLVDIFTQNSPSTCLSIKDSLMQLYASCLGLQFKILRAYPQTTQQLVGTICSLPDELEQIKSILLFEIMKNLPAENIRQGGVNNELLIKDAIPMFYINKYKTNNQRLRVFSERVWRFLKDTLTEAVDEDGDKVPDMFVQNIEIQNSDQIFKKIYEMFDSNNYDERIAAGLAMEDLCLKVQTDELGQSQIVRENIQRMYDLISGKYFNNKELLVDSFVKVMALMEQASPWRKDLDFLIQFVQTALKQIEKFNTSNTLYKNKIIECLNASLSSNGTQDGLLSLPDKEIENIQKAAFDQLQKNMDLVSENQNLSDGNGLTTFEEKKDEEKQTLQTIVMCSLTFSIIWPKINDDQKSSYYSLCMKKYSTTNFLVRNSILKSLLAIIQHGGSDHFELFTFILESVSNCGEKYDINLELLSTLSVKVSSKEIPIKYIESINKSSTDLIQILKEKGGDQLVKNVDLIRTNLAL